jgi:glyoxylase-like metal-dependent hydrolase (beta-lactamase superfamily II)
VSDPPSGRAGIGAALAAAGIRRALVPIPVPVPPTNAWILGTGKVTMVDCGALHGDAEARLAAPLARGERVRAVLVTHGHPDHHGAAQSVVAKHGAKVFCHAYDAPAVRSFGGVIEGRYRTWAKAATEHGAPEALVAKMGEHYARIAKMGADVGAVELLTDGTHVKAGDLDLEVLHLPGHTAGSLGFLDRRARILFSGDTVLPGITPNPFFEGISDHPSGPGPFLESLRKLQALEVDLVLPGHGEPLTNLRQVLDDYAGHHATRQAAIAEAVRARGAASAFEVVQALFPGARSLDVWLAFAEVFGHLQYMESLGAVERDAAAGRTVWRGSA